MYYTKRETKRQNLPDVILVARLLKANNIYCTNRPKQVHVVVIKRVHWVLYCLLDCFKETFEQGYPFNANHVLFQF